MRRQSAAHHPIGPATFYCGGCQDNGPWHASLRRAQPWPAALPRLEHHNPGADRRLLIEIHRILVDHANAAGGLARTNRPGLIGAMDAKICIVVPCKDTWRGRRADCGAAVHALPLCSATIDFLRSGRRSPFPWRIPVRPFLLALDRRVAIPDETSRPTRHRNGCPATIFHMVEIVIGGSTTIVLAIPWSRRRRSCGETPN